MTRCGHWDATDAREFFHVSHYCGTWTCDVCNHHAHINQQTGKINQNLARCWCGWSESGMDGRKELEDTGENCEDDFESWASRYYDY